MVRYILSRILQSVLTLLLTSVVVFISARMTGNPTDMLLPIETSPEEREAMIKRMGLDQPIVVQYWTFVKNALKGDFGLSFRARYPVIDLVRSRLTNSLRLASIAMFLTVFISIPLGILAAVHRGALWDKLAMGIALLGQSLPAFFTGMFLILVFAVILGWFPTSGIGNWKYFILPSVAIGWSASAGVVRLLRSNMLEVLDSEYVKFARIKGLSETVVIWKHAARNALIPVVTFIGFMYGIIIADVITVEIVFNWPGLGRLAYEAILWRDFPVIQLTVLTWASLIIIINLLVDLVYLIIDPRIRL